MQETLKSVVIDVVFELSQKPANKVADEDHLRLQGTQDGQKDRLQGSDRHDMLRVMDDRFLSGRTVGAHRNSYGNPAVFDFRLCCME